MASVPVSVPAAEAEAVKKATPHPKSINARLRAGEMLFYPGVRSDRVNINGSIFRPDGLKIVRRVGERDGVKGTYVWAERIDD